MTQDPVRTTRRDEPEGRIKVVYLAAGAAGMYCGACLHDNTLAAALLAAGQDVVLMPTYTPLRTDEENVSAHAIFYGGLNVYLQEKIPLFRHTPRFIDRLLDAWPLMSWLAHRRAGVDAKKLGAITVSMLEGEHGHQRKELHRLLDWLEGERPDAVHLSNTMFIALAGEIRRRIGVPVVCSLAGEDIFLERLVEPHYTRARELLKEQGGEVEAYVAMNRYYADFMTDYMDLDPDRVHVIHHGLSLEGHDAELPPKRSSAEGPFTIGYFARVCHDKGLHHLVEAFRILCGDEQLPPLRLVAAGYLGAEDRRYLRDLERRLQSWGLAERFEYRGEPDRAGKIQLLRSFDVMSVPTVYHESKGMSILEAMANGVPVVQPAHGSFPEMIEDTGGGVLVEPDDPAALAAAIRPLILDPALAAEYGRRGRSAVLKRYNAEGMARETIDLYRAVCGRTARVAEEAPTAESRTCDGCMSDG